MVKVIDPAEGVTGVVVGGKWYEVGVIPLKLTLNTRT